MKTTKLSIFNRNAIVTMTFIITAGLVATAIVYMTNNSITCPDPNTQIEANAWCTGSKLVIAVAVYSLTVFMSTYVVFIHRGQNES